MPIIKALTDRGFAMDAAKRTALFSAHQRHGGNIVDFHGWELPIWYSSMLEEHHATRNAAGLFDVSHMGSFRFHGSGVLNWLDRVGTQKASKFGAGRCAYTHFLDDNGNVIDDMIFAIVNETEVLGVPNASMIPVMYEWLSRHLPSDGSIQIDDLSEQTSILALQGPNAPQICEAVLGAENVVKHFRWREISENELGITGWIQGTGYTGERGFEIFIPNDQAEVLWEALLAAGGDNGLVPVGLGARDTLRMEKGFLLSGQDFHWQGLEEPAPDGFPDGFLSRTTIETNVPFGLDLEHDFIGRDEMMNRADNGPRWHALKVIDKGPFPRNGTPVYLQPDGNAPIGWITSGGPSPTLGRVGIAMAYLNGAEVGDVVHIAPNPRRMLKAEIVRAPFV